MYGITFAKESDNATIVSVQIPSNCRKGVDTQLHKAKKLNDYVVYM